VANESSKPEARDLTPAAKPTPAPVSSKLYPPVKAADLDRAKKLYADGRFADAATAIDGCERPEVQDSPETAEARKLSRKARLLDAVTKRITQSPLAKASHLEKVDLSQGGSVMGNVIDSGDKLTIQMPGGIETVVAKDDVGERTPVDRGVLVTKIKSRIQEKEQRLKTDDAIGLFRIGHYCWQYGLLPDAVPYLDKSVEGDEFPTIARVFGGSDSQKLVDAWCELTGKEIAGAHKSKAPATELASSGSPDTPAPANTQAPAPVSGNVAAIAKAARAKYDEGLTKYRLSYGDTKEAHANHVAAFNLFKEARDILEKAGDDPSVDDLRTDIARVLMDCRKRPI
jgi:hypothetical protein